MWGSTCVPPLCDSPCHDMVVGVVAAVIIILIIVVIIIMETLIGVLIMILMSDTRRS